MGCATDHIIPGPLNELDEVGLYRLLGEAWYAQRHIDGGQTLFLAPAAEVGKREFEKLAQALSEDLRRPCRYGVIPSVTSTIQRSATWRMPATLVAALAVKRGLVLMPSAVTDLSGGTDRSDANAIRP